MIKIQIVDDSQNTLLAIERRLRNKWYEVQTFTNPHTALQALKTNEYAVVIADYKMPIMDGITYLKHTKQRQPLAARVLLSAHAETNTLEKAINELGIYRFISKPWTDNKLEEHVISAINEHLEKVIWEKNHDE
ncbi:response regulator [Pseudomonas sp. TCU-HL1]|uniref:response regulator n=1 Tax=Pseudomonas sp. TCU-HL1 TaxID=1856685 RepID=UPI00083D0C49|nr:response regulator [Pseudomonas sp. TCU-HL1]AOE83123.1 transcriptional regulator [Pseudomonas sp. TCU-HL1]